MRRPVVGPGPGEDLLLNAGSTDSWAAIASGTDGVLEVPAESQAAGLRFFGLAAGVVGSGNDVFGLRARAHFDQPDGAAHLKRSVAHLARAAGNSRHNLPAHHFGAVQKKAFTDDGPSWQAKNAARENFFQNRARRPSSALPG